MNRQTNAKQTKARIQPKRNKQRAESAENSYATRRKKINVWSQIYRVIYQKTVLYWLYCTHRDHIWPRGHDVQHNFTILSLCQRLNTEEAKLRFYIPPKISKFTSNQLYLKTFQLLFFIHSLKRLVRQPRVSSVVKLVFYVVVTYRNQKSSLWIFKSIDSFRLGILTRKSILEMDSRLTCRRAKSIAFECFLCETSWNVTSMTS